MGALPGGGPGGGGWFGVGVASRLHMSWKTIGIGSGMVCRASGVDLRWISCRPACVGTVRAGRCACCSPASGKAACQSGT
eukprot:896222-Pyramimonas_sp.AAC.1